jgi:hypothetical protein
MTETYRRAPAEFTPEQWTAFDTTGRETGLDREPGRYRDPVRLLHRKRTMGRERFWGAG